MDGFSLVCQPSKFLIAPLRARPCQGHKESGLEPNQYLEKASFEMKIYNNVYVSVSKSQTCLGLFDKNMWCISKTCKHFQLITSRQIEQLHSVGTRVARIPNTKQRKANVIKHSCHSDCEGRPLLDTCLWTCAPFVCVHKKSESLVTVNMTPITRSVLDMVEYWN